MRIGINALGLLPGMIGGGEAYLRRLLDALGRVDGGSQYLVFTNRDNHQSFASLPGNFRRLLYDFPARWTVPSLFMTRVLGEQFYLSLSAGRRRLDVLHSPFDTVPLLAPCATVVTLHDINFDAFPEARGRLPRLLARRLVALSARRAEAIITVSDFSRGQIVSRLGVDAGRVWAVHNAGFGAAGGGGAEWAAAARRLGITKPYVIAFSSVNPHKNIASLIRAFARLRLRDQWQLVVVGHLSLRGEQLPALTRSLGLEGRVIMTGYLEDDLLRAALEHASALAFPSFYEGFGIPVIEAMQCGVPVACSRAGALPEVAANAALFFDPGSVADIAEVLERLLTDARLRQRLHAEGLRNARRFSWEQSARATLEVYRCASAGAAARTSASSARLAIRSAALSARSSLTSSRATVPQPKP